MTLTQALVTGASKIRRKSMPKNELAVLENKIIVYASSLDSFDGPNPYCLSLEEILADDWEYEIVSWTDK